MKIVVQVAENAKLYIANNVYNEIVFGALLLVSFKEGDTKKEVEKLADKVIKMRIFSDLSGKTNLSIKDVGGTFLSVSQFTLYGDFKGLRPSFTSVLKREEGEVLYNYFNSLLAKEVETKTGVFGADMKITFTNVGPSTYILTSDE